MRINYRSTGSGSTRLRRHFLAFWFLFIPDVVNCYGQCCGSMTFWCGSRSGSGSADLCLWLMDPDTDPDPAIFVTDLQDGHKKLIFFDKFFLLWRYIYIIFKDKKVKKNSQSSRNQGFSYYLCLVIEGSGTGSGAGSIPLTNGSGFGSRRPKNMWIRIRNTGYGYRVQAPGAVPVLIPEIIRIT